MHASPLLIHRKSRPEGAIFAVIQAEKRRLYRVALYDAGNSFSEIATSLSLRQQAHGIHPAIFFIEILQKRSLKPQICYGKQNCPWASTWPCRQKNKGASKRLPEKIREDELRD
jgi:hypothetical protein